MTDPYDLLRDGRVPEAVSIYRARYAQDPSDLATTSGLARGLMAIGEYAKALPLFKTLDAHAISQIPDSLGHKEKISLCHWCIGQRAEAIAIMRGLVSGVLEGSIGMGTGADAASQGLLLHYMAITEGDDQNLDYALRYLQTRRTIYDKRNWETAFPSHVVRYILGEFHFEAVLAAAFAPISPTLNISPDQRAEKQRIGDARHLAIALFHAGAKARSEGLEQDCMRRMKEVYALPNTLLEPEWYLARYEVERARNAVE